MYNLCVFSIFKNESHIFKEWIEHYLNEGVDHFYLIDNGSTDNYKDILESYSGKITLFYDESKMQQENLYNKYILPNIYETEWLICCDLDEFIWAPDGTIKSVLNNVSPVTGMIQIPWEQFGSNGHIKQPKSVIQSFTKRRSGTYTVELKYIVRSSAVEKLSIHFCYVKSPFKIFDSTFKEKQNGIYNLISEDIIKDSKLRCAHYQVQSYDWFTNVKMTRGDAVFEKNKRDESYFEERDYNDVFDDSLAQKKYTQNQWWFILIIFLLFLVAIKYIKP